MFDPFSQSVQTDGMGFTRNLLNRADVVRRDPAAITNLRLHTQARYLLFDDLKPVLDVAVSPPKLLWFGHDTLPELKEVVLLGVDDEIPHFAASVAPNTPFPGKALETRSAAMQMEVDETGILAQARSMLAWHENHSHCARCGAATTSLKGGYVRQCNACHTEHFPRTDPVAIMLVLDGTRCLLGRQKIFPPNMYSALAGFLEPGETLEDCVRREVWEEAGIKVGAVRYLASQPWPFPSSLMIGCLAEAKSTDINVDLEELEDARWFTIQEVRASLAGSGSFLSPPSIAIARYLLTAWVKMVG